MSIQQSDIYTCPHCGLISPIKPDNFWELYFLFGEATDFFEYDPQDDEIYDIDNSQDFFRIEMKRCEQCSNDTVSVKCIRGPSHGLTAQISPKTIVKKYPDYIPHAIRQDYEEACAITDLSPKAAATLARRCLQGVIRDFWGIKKNSLFDEINALKELIEPKLWQAMDDIRNIGNIGAHMEKDANYIIDVESNEAEIILAVIEHIFEATYIARENSDKLLSNLHTISENKLALRNVAPRNGCSNSIFPSAARTAKQYASEQEQNKLTEQGKNLIKNNKNLKDY